MRFIAVLAVIALTVYTVIDCARAEQWERRGLPTWLWMLVIVVLPVVGPIAWLVSRWSTPHPGSGGGNGGRRGPVAPDDDPDFLAGLDRSAPPAGRGNTDSKDPTDSADDEHNQRGDAPDAGSNGTDSKSPGPESSSPGGGDSTGGNEDPHRRGRDRRGRPGTNS